MRKVSGSCVGGRITGHSGKAGTTVGKLFEKFPPKAGGFWALKFMTEYCTIVIFNLQQGIQEKMLYFSDFFLSTLNTELLIFIVLSPNNTFHIICNVHCKNSDMNHKSHFEFEIKFHPRINYSLTRVFYARGKTFVILK